MLEYNRTTLDGLTDVEKAHYKEKDGRFVLDVKDEKDERVQGLIRNKNEAIAEKHDLQKKYDELERSKGGGAELEKAKSRIIELETQLKDAGKSGKYSEDQVNQIKRDLEAEYQTKIDEKDTALKTIRDQVSTSSRESAIKDALTQAGVRRGAVAMMTAFLKDRVEVIDGETGIPSIRIKKETGEGHEVSTKGDGSVFKTVPEFVEEIKSKSDYGFAFEGTKASGGGGAEDTQTTDTGGNGNFANIKSRADFKDDQAAKSKYLEHLREKHGGDEEKAQQEYFALPEQRPES